MSALPSLRDPPTSLGPLEIDTERGISRPLARDFYERPVVDLARALLGCLLVADGEADEEHATADGATVGVIVETEAYAGQEDLASHARAGLTRRTAPMFGQAGHAYVYLVYGMHLCLNVVGDIPGRAGAVLLRAVEPLAGMELMRRRRGAVGSAGSDARLAAGPARLCQAFGVTRHLDGHDLTAGRRLWLAAAPPDTEQPWILEGPRIGVEYAGEWAARPWRFGVAGSGSLSRPFPGGATGGRGR